ncbi:hypothetical protein FK004_16970 [Flavobacterium kingsejongi]|uniref:Uncharacterized protein n=1 Tax=Flavobacterium kingsejongi TaxID=1678728 RepID=A0A2S1LSZ8_9FLAO|nr:hypothetical protein FK004_16970 [Flavobacterium kingsejongi]
MGIGIEFPQQKRSLLPDGIAPTAAVSFFWFFSEKKYKRMAGTGIIPAWSFATDKKNSLLKRYDL